MGVKVGPLLARFYALLDRRVFPAIISFATHRLHIVWLMALWLGLLVGGSFAAFELVGGNYMNGISALASCVVLLQQMKHNAEHKRALGDLHAKVDALTSQSASRPATTTSRKRAK